MAAHGMTLHEALAMIRERRPIAWPNEGLVVEIAAFEVQRAAPFVVLCLSVSVNGGGPIRAHGLRARADIGSGPRRVATQRGAWSRASLPPCAHWPRDIAPRTCQKQSSRTVHILLTQPLYTDIQKQTVTYTNFCR
jgi:hypothetical protein